MKFKFLLLAIIACVAGHSCKKNGTGGDSEIAVWVKHHGSLIPGATVYIKYGAKEFPGTDVSKYDASKVCGTAGHGAGHTHFEGLLKGDYYLYATGYDSSIAMPVTGGIPVKIKKNGEEVEAEVPVTE